MADHESRELLQADHITNMAVLLLLWPVILKFNLRIADFYQKDELQSPEAIFPVLLLTNWEGLVYEPVLSYL